MREWHEQVIETTHFGWSINLYCFEIAVQWCYVLEIMQSWCHSELQMFSCMGRFCLKTWFGLYLLNGLLYRTFQQVGIQGQSWSWILLLYEWKLVKLRVQLCIFHLDFCLLISFSSYRSCLDFFLLVYVPLPRQTDRVLRCFFSYFCLNRLWEYFDRAWNCFVEG